MLAEATTAAQSTRSEVLAALRQASRATGSDFDYLLGTAMRESGLKPQAKSGCSSAAGLFQFVSQTWLGMIKQYGAKHGLGAYAATIHKGADDRYHADDHSDRQAILALRKDPRISALMAGEYANQTKCEMQTRLGRGVCSGELYAAHFLGAGAACRLIEMNERNPGANAAAAFPNAAVANSSVFYNRDGTAKTVRQVYDWTLKQPEVPARMLAQADAAAQAPAPADTVPSLSFAAPTFAGPGNGDALSMLAQFSDDTHEGAAGLLGQAAGLPQAPFVLTPGIVNVLASLTPDMVDKSNSRRTA